MDRAVDYNNTITYTFAGQYTFSFSVKAEEGVPLAPLNFRERGNADVNILKIGSDGIVYAYGFESSESNKSAISVSGVVINTETWTNITLCVDRTNYTVTYYINGEQTYSRTYSDTWVLAANSTYETTKINQWPGTVN